MSLGSVPTSSGDLTAMSPKNQPFVVGFQRRVNLLEEVDVDRA